MFFLKYLVFILSVEYLTSEDISLTPVACSGSVKLRIKDEIASLPDPSNIKVQLLSKPDEIIKESINLLPKGIFLVPLYNHGSYILKIVVPEGLSVNPTEGFEINFTAGSQPCSSNFEFFITGFSIFGNVEMPENFSQLYVVLTSVNNDIISQQELPLDGKFSFKKLQPGQFKIFISEEKGSILSKYSRFEQSLELKKENFIFASPIKLSGSRVSGLINYNGFESLGTIKVKLFASKTSKEVLVPSLLGCLNSSNDEETPSLSPDLEKEFSKFICLLDLDEDGRFSLRGLPTGRYLLFLKCPQTTNFVNFNQNHIAFNLQSSHIENIEFIAESLNFDRGFVLNGNSRPLSKAIISLDGNDITHSDSKGQFSLKKITGGLHKISIKSKGHLFLDQTILFDQNNPKELRLRADKIEVCLIFNFNQPLQSDSLPLIDIKDKSGDYVILKMKVQTTSSDSAKSCIFLSPDVYTIEVKPTNKMIIFAPRIRKIDLTKNNEDNMLIFSLFRAKVTGELHLKPSTKIKSHEIIVELIPENQDPSLTAKLNTKNSNIFSFEFKDVQPGQYVIKFSGDQSLTNICLVTSSGHLNLANMFSSPIIVNYVDLSAKDNQELLIKESGILRNVFVPKSILDLVGSISLYDTDYSWTLKDSYSNICVPEKISFLKCLSSCFKIQNIDLKTNNLELPILIKASSIAIPIKFEAMEITSQLQPGQIISLGISFSSSKPIKDQNIDLRIQEAGLIEENIWLDLENLESLIQGGKISFIPTFTSKESKSKKLYLSFKPSRLDIPIKDLFDDQIFEKLAYLNKNEGNYLEHSKKFVENQLKTVMDGISMDCSNLKIKNPIHFKYLSGVYLFGKIEPPVDQVSIEVYQKVPQSQRSPDGLELLATSVTGDKSGIFRVGPVPLQAAEPLKRHLYSMRLHKLGYIFNEKEGIDPWLFVSKQITMLKIFIITASDKKPLAKVLVSVINDSGLRKNEFTGEDGTLSIVDLPNGEYYVQPLLKEYAFRRTNTSATDSEPFTIHIREGQFINLSVEAVQVAFSIRGRVQSIAGTLLPNLKLEAVPVENQPNSCALKTIQLLQQSNEQTVSDSDGNYRIRGLTNGCLFDVVVRSSLTNRIEVSIPKQINVLISNKDVEEVNFKVIRNLKMGQISAILRTPDEFLSRIYLVVYPVNKPSMIIHRHSFAQQVSPFFFLHNEALDNLIRQKSDLMLSLEHNLSTSTFTNTSFQPILLPYNQLNQNQQFHFRIDFFPVSKRNL